MQDEVIAHKMWHLIDKQHGFFPTHHFTLEGCAAYAMKKFINKKLQKEFDEIDEFVEALYLGSGYIVQSYVDSKENPFKALLEVSQRDLIQNNILEQLKKSFTKKMQKTLEDEEGKKMIAYNMSLIPEFAELKGRMSAEGIICSYRKMGTEKLASELEKQDLTKLVQIFKSVGF